MGETAGDVGCKRDPFRKMRPERSVRVSSATPSAASSDNAKHPVQCQDTQTQAALVPRVVLLEPLRTGANALPKATRVIRKRPSGERCQLTRTKKSGGPERPGIDGPNFFLFFHTNFARR